LSTLFFDVVPPASAASDGSAQRQHASAARVGRQLQPPRRPPATPASDARRIHYFDDFRSAPSISCVFYNAGHGVVEKSHPISCPICSSDPEFCLPQRNLDWLERHIPLAAGLLRLVASQAGEALNASEIGRQLGVSYHAVQHRLNLLEKAGVVRVLPSLASRHPHILIRDCLLQRDLSGSVPALLRTCLTERIAQAFATVDASVRFFQWEAGRIRRIDLIACTLRERIGFGFTEGIVAQNRNLLPLRLGVERHMIDRGFLLYRGWPAAASRRQDFP
jgi:hypothetical protein